MKLWDNLKKFVILRFYIGLIIVGLFFSIISCIIIKAPKPEVMLADAVIQSITEYRDDFNDLQYEVLVNYTDANGIEHKGLSYTAYSSSMKVGDTVSIEYSVDDPEFINPTGGDFLPYIFLIIGLGCIAVGIIMTVKTVKTPAEDMNELDRVDSSTFDSEETARIFNSNEAMEDFYFHWCKKLNQSYVLETHDREAVWEANCDKIGVVTPYIYTFVNCRTGDSVTREISHTLTKSIGSDNFSIPTSSSFKIDGVNNWDFLAERGYSLTAHRSGLKLNFDVLHNGVKVGYLEAAGTNILKDGATSKLGEALPANGLYKVSCRPSEAENVFMAAFCVSRVEFY